MKMKRYQKPMSCILCTVLIVAMALFTTGCNGNNTPDSSAASIESAASAGVTELGEGATSFAFSVVDKDGNETQFEIHTDKATVGEALQELELIDGEDGAYGLYVKSVNGITADYDKDGVYWAFYINDNYAPTGVDSTAIVEGEHYSFKIE